MDEQRLKVRSLAARYAQTDVFNDLSFGVEGGELLAIMGRSGSGKSTLVESLWFCGTIRRDDSHRWSNRNEWVSLTVPALRRGVGLMFQNFALFPHMTVAENVGFGIRGHANQKARVNELLVSVELAGFEPGRLIHYPEGKSSG